MPKTKLDLQFPLYPVFILCFAFILLLLTLSPYIRQSQLIGPAATPTPAPQPPTGLAWPLPTSAPVLSSFTDGRLQIQINYPGNWAVNASPPSANQVAFDAPDGSSLVIYVDVTQSQSVADYLTDTGVREPKTVISSAAVNYAGYPGIQRSEEFTPAGVTTIATYFFHSGQIYKIEIMPIMDEEKVSSDQRALYDQILSTIKFL